MLTRSGRTITLVLAVLSWFASAAEAAPQRNRFPQERPQEKPTAPKPTPAPPRQAPTGQQKATGAPVSLPATPAPPPEAKPYDPQLMRLAEILGALTYLRGLCGDKDADAWRQRMQALLDAEGTPAVRKDRLAGAYNNGVAGYSLSYRTCTPNARVVIERFLAEGERIAKEIENRYRAT